MDSEPKKKKVRIAPEEDRISRLSDDLIHIIMSFLDIKLAVQTCVLSKRWKLIWTTLPYLKFRSYDYNSPNSSLPQTTSKFLYNFLEHRNHQSLISSMKLMFRTLGFFEIIVKYAISRRVQCLNIHSWGGPFKLSMFNSNYIEKLKLEMKFQDIVSDSDCWDLPALTTLHLTRLHYDHTRNLPDLCLTCLPALTTLCLTDWDLGKSLFSFNFPALATLRLSNCKLPGVVWNFPALKSLALHDLVFPGNMKNIFAALVSLENLSLFFYKKSVGHFQLPCPQLVNLEIKVCYCHKSGNQTGYISVLAPRLRNVTSVGIFKIGLDKSKLDNVRIKLKGWIEDHMILPREELKNCYAGLRHMLLKFGSAKNLHLDLETVEALSLVKDYFVGYPSPFSNLNYVKLPLGCKEPKICSTLRSYLLGGSPTATIITTWPQNNMISNLVPAETSQNVVIQEPLTAPTKVYFDSNDIHKTVSIDIVDIGVQKQDLVENYEVQAHKVRHVVAPVEGTENDRASSSKENSDFGIWRGHEVNSEFVYLLDLIMNKYPETFEHYTTKIKKFCTMELNMLCTSISDFTKMSMAKVETEVIAEYRAVFAELRKYGFSVSWLENHLNYVEELRFTHPLIPELRAIDCHIDDTKSKLQELQTKLQDLKTVGAEKMEAIRNVFGTMGANLSVGCIGDDLFCV